MGLGLYNPTHSQVSAKVDICPLPFGMGNQILISEGSERCCKFLSNLLNLSIFDTINSINLEALK